MSKTTLEAVSQKLDDGLSYIRADLTEIKKKQDYTNGKVRKGEEWRIAHEKDAERRDASIQRLSRLVLALVGTMPLSILEVRQFLGALLNTLL